MDRVAVVADSVCCIPSELVKELDICVIPLLIIHEGKSYRDGVDMSPTEVYRLMRKRNVLPTTSIPSPGDIIDTYRRVSRKADSILCITVTGLQSKMYDSALLAKEMAGEELAQTTIEVMDSRAVAGAMGFIVLAAARAAQQGASLADVMAAAESMKSRVSSLFMLDTLYYLARTGRIAKAAAWAGAVLDMKPVVEHSTAIGETTPVARPRTKSKALGRMLDIMSDRIGDAPAHVMVHHGDELEEAEKLKSRIADRFNCVELYVTDFTPAMGVHAGPGLLAVSFYAC